MGNMKFTCLYTKHKTRKSKIWQDGFIHCSDDGQVRVFSSENRIIDLLHSRHTTLEVGAELESEKFLITVEARCDGFSETVPPSSEGPAPQMILKTARRPPIVSQVSVMSRQREASGIAPCLVEMISTPIICEFGLRRSYSQLRVELSHGYHRVSLKRKRVQTNQDHDYHNDRSLFAPQNHEHKDVDAQFSAEGSRMNQSFRQDAPIQTRSRLLHGENVESMKASSKRVIGQKYMRPSQQEFGGTLLFLTSGEICKDYATKIPDSFTNLKEYASVMSMALYEVINLSLLTIGENFRRAATSLNSNVICNCNMPAAYLKVKKDGTNKGRQFYGCSQKTRCNFFVWADSVDPSSVATSSQLPSHLTEGDIRMIRSHGVTLFGNCELFYSNKKKKEGGGSNVLQTFLRLPTNWMNMKVDFAAGDLWVLSKKSSFDFFESENVIGIYEATSHGPGSKTNLMSIEPLNTKFSATRQRKPTEVFAIHLLNMKTHLTMLSTLRDLPMNPFPLMKCLLNQELQCEPNLIKCSLTTKEISKKVDETITKWNLNDDQIRTIHRVANWVKPGTYVTSSNNNAILLHGIFGSGKSYLLVAIIFLIIELIEMDPLMEHVRIMICAVTNVAVDRILLSLLSQGYDSFIRVGSLKRVSRKILPYVVCGSGSESECKDAIRDCEDLLRNAPLSAEDSEIVKMEMELLKSGQYKEKLEKFRKAVVVGATCASACSQLLEEQTFPIVFIDESRTLSLKITHVLSFFDMLNSQMMEPLSILPMARVNASYVLLAGDPYQLPPTITVESALTKTLYSRLDNLGREPIMLRTQYRCHPRIAELSSRLFYNGQVMSSRTAHDLQPVLPTFPALCLFDSNLSSPQRIREARGSISNEFEADVILRLIAVLIFSNNVDLAEIGVISFFTAQVEMIKSKMRGLMKEIKDGTGSYSNVSANVEDLHKSFNKIEVSTIDAFQGAEKSVIVLSCCKTVPENLEFISNSNRLNVAITRARKQLFIVGDKSVLHHDQTWNYILKYIGDFPNSIHSGEILAMKDIPTLLKELLNDSCLKADEDGNNSTIRIASD